MSGLFSALSQYIKDALPGGSLNPELNRQETLDALAMSTFPIPVVGDVAGLAADANRLYQNPQERTPFNYGMMGLGMLPFVPGSSWYHGTRGAVNPANVGNISKAGSSAKGMWLTNDPVLASKYAETAGLDVMKGPSIKTMDIGDSLQKSFGSFGDIRSALNKDTYEGALDFLFSKNSGFNTYHVQEMLPKLKEYYKGIQEAKKVDELQKGLKTGSVVYNSQLDKYTDLLKVNIKGKDLTEAQKIKAIEKAQKQGKQGVVFKNAKDAPEAGMDVDPADIAVIFDPTRLDFLEPSIK